MQIKVKNSIFLSLGTFLFFGVQQLTDWILITFSGIRGLPYFIDLRSVLKSSDCERVYGWDIYDPSIAHNCSYIYGSNLIRLLHLLHFSEKSTYIAGWILMFLFSMLLGTTLSALEIKGRRNWCVVLLVLFSPPTMLLLERANIDILIILLMAIFSYAATINRSSLSYVALLLASVSKFYTAPIFVWLFLMQKNVVKRIASLLLFVVSCTFIFSDLARINGNIPRNSWASFGNPIFGIYFRKLGYDLPARLQDLIGVLLFIGTLIAITILSKFKVITSPKFDMEFNSEKYISNLAQSFALVFLSCYFASVSYDYRLVFLFIPAVYILNSSSFEHKTKSILTVSLVLTAWLSYASNYLQILGDIAILPWVVVLTQNAFVSMIKPLRNSKEAKDA